MNLLSLALGAFKVVGAVLAWLHDQRQFDAGAHDQFARDMAEVARRTGVAAQVAAHTAAMSDADLDSALKE